MACGHYKHSTFENSRKLIFHQRQLSTKVFQGFTFQKLQDIEGKANPFTIHAFIYLSSHLISVDLDKVFVFIGQRIRIEVYRSRSYGHTTPCFYKNAQDEIEMQRSGNEIQWRSGQLKLEYVQIALYSFFCKYFFSWLSQQSRQTVKLAWLRH